MTWTTQVRILKGEPWAFDKREYLLPLYRDPSPEIYIVKGRQTEITEYALNWLLYHLWRHPFTIGMYLSDRDDHVSIFSKLRLHDWGIDQSPILQAMAADNEGNVSWQPWKNGAHLYMFSGWGDFEKAMSIPADFLVIDEAQKQNLEALAKVRESASHSKYKKLLAIGTGSDEGDDWYKLWMAGDQKEWDAKAKAWVAKMPENFKNASSYHLPQWIAPWITPEEIEKKRNHPNYTPRRFVQEIEGWWYKGKKKPFTEADIRACFSPTMHMLAPEEVDHSKGWILMGVDWGGGEHTVPWIGQCLDSNLPRFQLIYATRLETNSTEKQADEIARLIDAYKVDQGVMDAGGGTYQVEKLTSRYATRMLRCSYMTRPEDPIEFVDSENRVVVDRTWIIEKQIDLITRPEPHPAIPKGIPRMFIPASDLSKVEWMIDQFTCIEAEEVNPPSGKKYVRYVRPQEHRDDALHAQNYFYLAYLYKKLRGAGTIQKVEKGFSGGSQADDKSWLWK